MGIPSSCLPSLQRETTVVTFCLLSWTKKPFQNELCSVLQIRRGKRDNLGIIFHITPMKHMM